MSKEVPLTMPLSNIRIVMLNTFHPGNIGSAARAMKTMGLSDLVLVNPRAFPDAEAVSLAAGAGDTLDTATVVSSLEEAIYDRSQVFATSARQTHSFTRPEKSVELAAEWIKDHSKEKVAIVFGGERDGMSASEIEKCQQILFIPGNSGYSVLNVSAAVQIVCYELFKTLAVVHDTSNQANPKSPDTTENSKNNETTSLANQNELQNFYSNLEILLTESGYIRKEQHSSTLTKLRTFINRAEPTSQDISLLRGMVKSLAKNNKQ